METYNSIEVAKQLVKDGKISQEIAETIFPQLKESEDERIRKAIHIYLDWLRGRKDYAPRGEYSIEDMISWLDKKSMPQVRTGIEWEDTIDDACDKIYSTDYNYGEYCHEQSFKWGFQEGVEWLEKQGKSEPIGKLQLSEELYEHIRNTCACIDDALSSETLAGINDYLSMAERSAQSAFNMIEKQGSQNLANSAKTCKVEQNPADKDELFDHRYTQHLVESQRQKSMIQCKGDNLKEVIDFTGKDRNFDKWFKSFEEYEQYVQKHNNIFKLFNADGSHYEVPVGAWIVKTPDGCNVASKAIFRQKSAWSEEDDDMVDNIFKAIQYLLKENDSWGFLEDCLDWLKAFKERCTWKTSDEQMEYLAKAMAMDEADKRKDVLQNERELNPDAFTKEASADNQALLDAAKDYKERTPFQYPNQLQPAYEAFIAGAQWHKQYWDKIMRDNHVKII